MTEIRCKKCGRLLMKAIVVMATVKCPKCGHIQNIEGVDIEQFLKGQKTTVAYGYSFPLWPGETTAMPVWPQRAKIEITAL